MADVKQGIAIVQNDAYMKFVDAVFSVQQEPPVAPDGELEAENERAFCSRIMQAVRLFCTAGRFL